MGFVKGRKGRREVADIFMNGAENPGAGAQWPTALHSHALAHTLQSGPSDQALGPSPCGGQRGGCFCTAPASASTGKSEVGRWETEGPTHQGTCPCREMEEVQDGWGK